MSMGLNLKDEETVALVSEVATRLGTTKTAAVRDMARQRLAELKSEQESRHDELINLLETEIWPRTAGKSITKEEIEDLLGYNDMVE